MLRSVKLVVVMMMLLPFSMLGSGMTNEGSFSTVRLMEKSKSGKLEAPTATLEVSEGVMKENLEISLSSIAESQLPKLDRGMTNVTDSFSGYRFLPHGEHFDGKGAKVVLGYDRTKIPSGYTEDDIRTYYYDEQLKHWVALERDSVDRAHRTIVSHTTHFTDMINGVIQAPESPETQGFAPTMMSDLQAADPTAKVQMIEAPQVNNSGTASLSYSMEMPPARNGMAPKLSIYYSSDAGSGWLGEGWNLSTSSITVDTRWGVPRYNPGVETETYMMDGQMLLEDGVGQAHRISEMKDRKSGKVRFYPRKESAFSEIVRIGDKPSNYIWEVTDRKGTKYTYGAYQITETKDEYGDVTKDTTIVGVVKGKYQYQEGNIVISEWRLTRVEEIHGDYVEYIYKEGLEPVTEGYYSYCLYLDSVKAGNAGEKPHTVVVLKNREAEKGIRQNNARYGYLTSSNKLLESVEVWFEGSLLRSYKFNYTTGAFHSDLLASIVQLDSKGNEFNKHTLKYKALEGDLYDNNPISYTSTIKGSEGRLRDKYFDEIKPGFGSGLSMINGTASTDGFSVGGGANLGVGPAFAGANYNYGHDTGEGRISLTDLNGDGLPDKVYLNKDDKLYYQPAIYGSKEFGDPVPVPGAPKNFSESTSNTNSLNEDVGVGYSVASVSGTFAETWTHSRTKAYFSDVNSDGLIDIVYHGTVYFNHLENGHPVFSRFSSQTDNVLGKMSLQDIETEKITYTEEDRTHIEDSLKTAFPLHDVVRAWRAPFSGKINIDGTVTLTENNGNISDGIRFFIQKQKGNILTGKLNPGESKPAKATEVVVEKGDYVFFRLNSIVQGESDIVSWNPTIEYTEAEGTDGVSIPKANELGITWMTYDAEKDFIGGVDSMAVILGGNLSELLKIEGAGYKKTGKTLSDIQLNIRYRIKGTGTDFRTKTQTITLGADETFEEERFIDLDEAEANVKVGDTLYLSFFLTSDIPYDPRVISWNPMVRTTYTPSEEGAEPIFDTIYRTPVHKMFNNVISSFAASEMKIEVPEEDDSYVFDEGHENEVKILIEGPENVSGKYVRSYIFGEEDKSMTPVKNGDYLPIEKWNGRNVRIVTYVDSVLETSHRTTAHFTLSKKETVKNEDNVEEEILIVDTLQSVNSSLYGLFNSTESQMGQLFHGWGQFGYRGDSIDEATKKPVLKEEIILEQLTAELELDEEQQNKLNEIVGDEDDYEDLSEDEQIEKLKNNKAALADITGNANENNFFVMSYNSKEKRFYAGTQFAHISATGMASSRLGNPIVDVDAEIPNFSIAEDQEIIVDGKSVKLSGAASAPELYSKAFTFSGTLGGGIKAGKFGIGASGSYSNTETETVKAFMDLNGDGYPDWITQGDHNMEIQYTTTRGTLGSQHKKMDFNLPEQEANAFSGGLSGSGSGGTPNPQTNKGDKTWSRANLIAMAKEKANSASALSASASGNFSSSTSKSKQQWIDVNGDGLPDMVYANFVKLNIGYGFIQVPFNNGPGRIDESESSSEAAGFSVSVPLCGSANISGGANATFSKNNQTFMYTDVNGDGLPDYIAKEKDNRYYAYLNLGLGKGFDSNKTFISSKDIAKSKSTSLSIHANGGATIPAFIFTVTPFVNGAKSFAVSRTNSSMSDFNGDGFIDLLESDSENNVSVRYSRIGAANKLESVINPFGGKFTIEYAHTTPTTDHPCGKWAMSALTVNDATGMNPAIRTTFSYENGKQDRREREFLGFGKVTTTNVDEQGNPVRSVIAEYDVQHYLTAGAPIHNLVVSPGTETDEQGNLVDIKHKEDITSYAHYSVTNGSQLKEVNISDFTKETSLFSAPKAKKAIAYEYHKDETNKGVQDELELSSETYDYTENYGNLSAYSFRDLTNKTDNGFVGYDDTIQYSNQKLGLATSVEVKGTDGTLYRKVTAEYKDKRTPTAMTQMVQHLDGGKKAEFTFKYDQYGNMVRRTFPTEEATNEDDRSFFAYEYDRKYHMYPERVTDAFGYHSEMEDYDYRYGIPRTVRDMNGYTVRYHIDDLGRTDTIVAPNEQSDAVPYTIAYKYVLGGNYTTSYAVTDHYDPQHPDNPLQTVTHVDGLGRPYQVKKDAEIQGEGEKMIVSGRTQYDALGRTIKIYHPTTCDLAKATEIVEFSGSLLVDSTFDAIDRLLTQTLLGDESDDEKFQGDAVTKISYSIKDGLLKTTLVDAIGNEQYSYTNGAGQIVRTARDYKKMEGEDTESMEEKVYAINYAYDPIGQLLSVTDAAQNKTTYTYDMAGRKLSVEHPSAGLTTFVYDVAGNVVEKQTPNLAEEGASIQYVYKKNRLESVKYPKHTENNVTYTYGGVNAPHNRVGRLALIEDGSGATEFFYGRMGELTKQRRTLVIPNQAVATYTTEWTYDSHNRIQTMTYPDGEVVSYRYNLGGLLSSVSGKKDYTYDYVEEIGYDEYEQKKYMKYGNGVETNYGYSTKRRRLGTLVVSNQKGNIMDNTYSYDQLDNITKLVNKGMAQQTKDGKTIGGGVTHNYTYDAWNRLVEAHGTFSGADDKSAKYDLFMAYDELYNVTSKKLDVEQTNLQFPGTLKAGHTLKYQYDRENNDPFRLLSVSASEYRVADDEGTVEEVTDDKIVNTRSEYAFDANGNQTQVATGKEAKEDVEELSQTNLRQLHWDEENRLLAINDNGYVSSYFYDANGERTVKMSAGMEELYINGSSAGDEKEFDAKFVAYVSPYLVLKNGGEYTKHIYAGKERIASKIGDFESFGADPRRVEKAGESIREIKYKDKYDALGRQLTENYDTFNVAYNLKENKDYENNASFCCGNKTLNQMKGNDLSSVMENTRPEDNIFFYHPDYLGSTALVTDADGEVTQHVAYIPYGEVFIEEQNGVWNTPYLFNAKELDEKTGLYYYGARYLNPKDTRWLSVDPMFEMYEGMTPYNYCLSNPINNIDPNGTSSWRRECYGFWAVKRPLQEKMKRVRDALRYFFSRIHINFRHQIQIGLPRCVIAHVEGDINGVTAPNQIPFAINDALQRYNVPIRLVSINVSSNSNVSQVNILRAIRGSFNDVPIRTRVDDNLPVSTPIKIDIRVRPRWTLWQRIANLRFTQIRVGNARNYGRKLIGLYGRTIILDERTRRITPTRWRWVPRGR